MMRWKGHWLAGFVALAALLLCGCTGVGMVKKALSKIFPPPPAELIIRLKSEDADLRRQSVVSLGRIRNVKELSGVLKIMGMLGRHDLDPTVRSAAIGVMGRIGEAQFVEPLQKVLELDKDAGVRADAALALGKFKQPEAREALIAALGTDPSGDVRTAAAANLRSYNSTDAAEALAEGLEDRDPAVAYACSECLRYVTGQDLPAEQSAWLAYLSENKEPYAKYGKMPRARKMPDQREEDRDKRSWFKRLFPLERRVSELD
ncbi:MAG: HEAT repeat domain-containing protein [Phycisphaerae bacterium]|nr:HEAT repeat domain-containing protein [Phycisphaerae bacterium]